MKIFNIALQSGSCLPSSIGLTSVYRRYDQLLVHAAVQSDSERTARAITDVRYIGVVFQPDASRTRGGHLSLNLS